MKSLITLLFLFFLPLSYGQIDYFKLYSDGGDDFGEGIVQLEDSSYVITGSSSSFTNGPSQAFLLKTDSLGNYMWSNHYGGPESDGGKRVIYNPGDGFFVAGYTNSSGNGAFDCYLFKTDLNGSLTWEKTFGGSGWDRINDAVLTSDNSLFLVGENASNATNNKDIYLLKTDLNGDTLWTMTLGGNGDDYATSVHHYNDSLLIIGGTTYLEDSLRQRGLIISMHQNGTIYWKDTIGSIDDFVINDLTVVNNEIIAVGRSNNESGSQFGALRVKTDLSGNILMESVTAFGYFFSYEQISELGTTGTILVSFEYEEQTISANQIDLAIWKYSSSFVNMNQWTPVPYGGDDLIGQTIQTSDGAAISVGTTDSYNTGYRNVFVAKIGPNSQFPDASAPHDQEQLVEFDQTLNNSVLNVYPNPVKTTLHLRADELVEWSVSIRDMFGKVVYKGENEDTVDLNYLPNGVYILQLTTPKGVYNKKFVIGR